MDVIINYGINYKKCAQVSYSGYQRKSLLAHLLHHVIHKNKEISYALIAELHCSSYYNIPRQVCCRNLRLFYQYL